MEQFFGVSKKQLIVGFLILIILAGAIFYLLSIRSVNKSYFMGAVIERVDGNSIYVKNKSYVLSATNDVESGGKILGEINDSEEEVEIIVSSNTKITKAVVILPNQNELGDYFDPADLKKEIVEGTINDLSQNKEINIKSLRNIYGKKRFTASEISYSELIFPNE